MQDFALTTSGVEAPSVCEVLSALLRLSAKINILLNIIQTNKKMRLSHKNYFQNFFLLLPQSLIYDS